MHKVIAMAGKGDAMRCLERSDDDCALFPVNRRCEPDRIGNCVIAGSESAVCSALAFYSVG